MRASLARNPPGSDRAESLDKGLGGLPDEVEEILLVVAENRAAVREFLAGIHPARHESDPTEIHDGSLTSGFTPTLPTPECPECVLTPLLLR
jgi:hypothetical protein